MPLLITPHAPAERVELDLTVEPNALCVRTSRASGEALRVATAGEPSVIRVTALDACGNGVMSTAGDRFDVFLWDVKRGRRVNPRDPRLPRAHSNTYDRHGDDAMSGVCGRPCILELEGCWQPHSVHELTYSCDLAGRFDLWIQYTDPTGVHRPLEVASPSQLEVVPNRADARGSSLLPEGSFGQMLAAAPTVTAGAELIVGVRVADRFGNSTMPRNGELRATMEGPGGSVDLSACLLVEASEEGLHTLRQQLKVSGDYTLNVTINGAHIIGSPLGPFSVCAAEPEGPYSLLVPPKEAPASQAPFTVTVLCRDRFGNAPALPELEAAVACGDVTARIDGGPARSAHTIRATGDHGSVELTILGEQLLSGHAFEAFQPHYSLSRSPFLSSIPRPSCPGRSWHAHTFSAHARITSMTAVQVSGYYRLNVWVGGLPLPTDACPHILEVHPSTLSPRPASRHSSPNRHGSPNRYDHISSDALTGPFSPSLGTPRAVLGSGCGATATLSPPRGTARDEPLIRADSTPRAASNGASPVSPAASSAASPWAVASPRALSAAERRRTLERRHSASGGLASHPFDHEGSSTRHVGGAWPRNNTSPRAWHGIAREATSEAHIQRSPRANTGSAAARTPKGNAKLGSSRTPPRTYRGRPLSTGDMVSLGRVLDRDLAAADPGKAIWSKGSSPRAWHLVDVTE